MLMSTLSKAAGAPAGGEEVQVQEGDWGWMASCCYMRSHWGLESAELAACGPLRTYWFEVFNGMVGFVRDSVKEMLKEKEISMKLEVKMVYTETQVAIWIERSPYLEG